LSAFEDTLLEIGEKNIGNSADEIREHLTGYILWKLFARGAALWISAQTGTGSQVPLNVLVTAYALWKNALRVAARHRMDALTAADALVKVAHNTADLLSGNAGDSESMVIHDVYHYLYTGYVHMIRRIASGRAPNENNSVEIEAYIAKYRREFSDRGASREALYHEILFEEVLGAMQPKGRSVVYAQYVLGYSWPETAKFLGISVNAARKALSFGIRTVMEIYGQELAGTRSRKIPNINAPHLKMKRMRFRRKMGDGHERHKENR
jgi:DNA-directed RNA polymerase specialized sigma24 family protein